MVTLDRRKLTAPVFAQAAAFVAVLVIGGLTGHGGGKPTPGPSSATPRPPAASTSPAPHISVTSRGATVTEHSTELTVLIAAGEGIDVRMPSAAVQVREDDLPLAPVVNQGVAGIPIKVPADHAYLVCVKPPAGWVFTGPSPGPLPDADCTTVKVGSQAAQTAEIPLAPDTGPATS